MNSRGNLLWSMSGFCFWLFRFLSVLCDAVVISQGSVFCPCSFEPFTTRPVFGGCLRPSSSSVWFVSSATFFFLSLSQALGNPKPFWFGVPLVFFFILDTLSALDPYVFLLTYTQALPRTCFFLFVVVARFRFGVFSFLVLSVSVVLVGVFFVPGPGLCRVAALSFFLSWPNGAFFFFWVGGVPLAAFSLCFPLGSRGVGGGFSLLFSCVLHLSCT